MSLRAMAAAWDQPVENWVQRLVLLALADHANDDGECWPAVSTLATKCGLGGTTVRRALVALTTAGVVVKVQRRRHTNGSLGTWWYRLPFAVDNAVDQRSQRTLGTESYRPHGALGTRSADARDALSGRAESVIEPVTESLGARARNDTTARAVDNGAAPTGTRAYAPPVLGHCDDCGRLAIACTCDRGAPPPRKDLE